MKILPPVSIEARRLLPSRWDLLAAVLVMGFLVAFADVSRFLVHPLSSISGDYLRLDPWDLPGYALRTSLRMLIALAVSLAFTFSYATWAAKNPRAGTLLVPLLDILQSIPILSFLSLTIVWFLSLSPGRILGAELACVFVIAGAFVVDFTTHETLLPQWSLVPGLTFYYTGAGTAPAPGVMHEEIGGYRIDSIDICAAFDVHAGKVGRDVSEAILVEPNNTMNFAKVAHIGVNVQRGVTLDGLGRHLSKQFSESSEPSVDIAEELKRARADVVVSYLPVGSQQASEFYAEEAMKAGCAYVNCIPVFLASNAKWRKKFETAKLPIIGDDIKSQVGATIVHRVLASLSKDRGVHLNRTYQLNFGGNTDFLNMLDRERLKSKKISKTQSVNSQLAEPLPSNDIHIGPSDFVPWLEDRKFAHIRMEGTGFGGSPISIDMKLEVWDSPNAAGVVVDAVRCAKLALDRGFGGALVGPSSYFMKSPPQQFIEYEARSRLESFIRGE